MAFGKKRVGSAAGFDAAGDNYLFPQVGEGVVFLRYAWLGPTSSMPLSEHTNLGYTLGVIMFSQISLMLERLDAISDCNLLSKMDGFALTRPKVLTMQIAWLECFCLLTFLTR